MSRLTCFELTGRQQQALRNPYRAYQQFIDRYNATTGFETTPLDKNEFARQWFNFNQHEQYQFCDLICRDIDDVIVLLRIDPYAWYFTRLFDRLDYRLYKAFARYL